MNRPSEFGEALYRCRQARRFTQWDLGSAVDLSQSSISNLEWGAMQPTQWLAGRLEAALSVPAGTLAVLIDDSAAVDGRDLWDLLELRDGATFDALRTLAVNALLSSALTG